MKLLAILVLSVMGAAASATSIIPSASLTVFVNYSEGYDGKATYESKFKISNSDYGYPDAAVLFNLTNGLCFSGDASTVQSVVEGIVAASTGYKLLTFAVSEEDTISFSIQGGRTIATYPSIRRCIK